MKNSRLGNALSTLLVAAASAVSCGKDPTVSVDLSFDEYVGAVIDLDCRFLVACDLFPDDSSCRAAYFPDTELATIREDLRSGRMTFDGAVARQCLDALRAVTDACDVSTRIAAGPQPKCGTIVVGHTESGHGCSYSEQCVPGSYCERGDCIPADGQCCPGTCTPFQSDLAVGQPCGPHDTCAEGAFCRRAASSQAGSCAPLLTVVGARCEGQQCAPPLLCAYDSPQPPFASRSCRRLVTTGSDCSPDSHSNCGDLRDHCDPVSKTCIRKEEIGATCQPDLSLDSPCRGYASCDPATKTCRPLGKIGDPCDLGGGQRCLANLICDATTATCRGPNPGKVCASS